jgi:hypothetical protein
LRLADGRWHAGTVLEQAPDGKGYLRVRPRNGPKSSTNGVHVLVAETFLGAGRKASRSCTRLGGEAHGRDWRGQARAWTWVPG